MAIAWIEPEPLRGTHVARRLHLSRASHSMAVLIYLANEPNGRWEEAPIEIRRRCTEAAERAVMEVSGSRVMSAREEAEHAMTEAIDEAVRDAFYIDQDHTARHLVRHGLERMARLLKMKSLAAMAIRTYQGGLTK